MDLQLLEKEKSLKEIPLDCKYIYIIIQCGYILLFGGICPVICPLAFAVNVLVLRNTMNSLTTFRRPFIDNRAVFGVWLWCLYVLISLCVLVNGHILFVSSSSDTVSLFVPTAVLPMVLETPMGRWILFAVFEHVVALYFLILTLTIEEVPKWIIEAQATENDRIQSELINMHARVFVEGKFTPIYDKNHKIIDTYNIERKVVRMKVLNQETLFGSSFVQRFHVPMSIILMLPVLTSQILHQLFGSAGKDKVDRQVAVGLLGDPEDIISKYKDVPTLKHCIEYDVNNFETIQMINFLLQRSWMYLSPFIRYKIMNKGQEIINRKKPSFVYSTDIVEVFPGTIAPVLSGINIYPANKNENFIRFDLDFIYSGDSKVSIRIKPISFLQFTIHIEKFIQMFTLRIELTPLRNSVPPWTQANVSFLRKPVFDTTLCIEALNISNIGIAWFKMSKFINFMFQFIASRIALYPKYEIIEFHDHLDGLIGIKRSSISNFILDNILIFNDVDDEVDDEVEDSNPLLTRNSFIRFGMNSSVKNQLTKEVPVHKNKNINSNRNSYTNDCDNDWEESLERVYRDIIIASRRLSSRSITSTMSNLSIKKKRRFKPFLKLRRSMSGTNDSGDGVSACCSN
eukprot:gene12826-27046_t